jgi:uncharacterized protein (DUF58 family)
MIPSRRWLRVAMGLALVGLLGLLVPGAWRMLLVADGVWLLALWWDWRRSPVASALMVTRQAPGTWSVGRPLPLVHVWRARVDAPVTLRVRETWPAPLAALASPIRTLEIPPGGSAREEVTLIPPRRGVGSGGRLDLQLGGPWGLAWRRGRLEEPWALTILPNLSLAGVRGLPASQRRREAGQRQLRRPGEGRLFEGLREWVPGDDTRNIDWKATARRAKPIVRQYEDERRQPVLLALDAGRLMVAESGGVSRFESAVTAAVRLAHAAVERDDDVGLLVFDDGIRVSVPPSRGREGLRRILFALAGVEPRLVEPDYPAAFRELAARNRRRALTVIFTDVIDARASDALVGQAVGLRPRHVPVAVTMRDPAIELAATARATTPQAAYERAAAEAMLGARAEALDAMRRGGVVVVDVSPAGAAEAIVREYEQLKRRGVV